MNTIKDRLQKRIETTTHPSPPSNEPSAVLFHKRTDVRHTPHIHHKNHHKKVLWVKSIGKREAIKKRAETRSRGILIAPLLVHIRALVPAEPSKIPGSEYFRKADLQKYSLVEFRRDARFFARDREGCCVGGLRHARAVSGGRVALGSSRCLNLILKTNQNKFPKRRHHYRLLPSRYKYE